MHRRSPTRPARHPGDKGSAVRAMFKRRRHWRARAGECPYTCAALRWPAVSLYCAPLLLLRSVHSCSNARVYDDGRRRLKTLSAAKDEVGGDTVETTSLQRVEVNNVVQQPRRCRNRRGHVGRESACVPA